MSRKRTGANITVKIGGKWYDVHFQYADDNQTIAAVYIGANSSPIMESLQALTTGTPGFVTFTGPRKIILVSDLLQHSEAMSFYRGDDWQRFAASPAFQRLGRTLDGVDVEIFAVPRVVEKIRDPAVVEDFWLRYFDLQGARLPNAQPGGSVR